jgi:hypothetical protein
MGGPLALDGHHLMGGHNNQPKVGIDSGRGIEEERRQGRNVWEGVVSSLGAANQRRKMCCLFAWSGKSTKKKNDNKNNKWP